MTVNQTGLQSVETDEGPITVASLEALSQSAVEMEAVIRLTDLQCRALEDKAAQALARAGWLLTVQRDQWRPGDRSERIAAAQGLGELLLDLQENLDKVRARPHHGLGGVIGHLKDDHEVKRLQDQLGSAQVELTARYHGVSEGLDGVTGIPEADALLDRGREAADKVALLRIQNHEAQAALDRRRAEIKHRTEIQTKLGFDALGVMADLTANGLRPVPTALVLKAREIAVLEVPATLCRHKTRTQFVGGSQGFSVPVGHGFRYRVSSFRGHPVQSEYLAQVDAGRLVVTNQRLAFLGNKRDVAVSLAKLLQVEPFSNAIAIAREGKESKDIYLVANPARVLLYLNWVTGHQGPPQG